MSDNVIDLDYLLEPVKPVTMVRIAGVEYQLMNADIMENFLSLMAMTEKAAVAPEIGDMDGDPAEVARAISDKMEELRQELRNMIRILVPDLPDAVLRERCPKLDQLRELFTRLITEVTKQLPESVKKNSDVTQNDQSQMAAGNAKKSL